MEQRIKQLFRKYLSNTCTEAELDEFFQCIRQSDADEALRQILQETYDSLGVSSETFVNDSGHLIIPAPQKPIPAVGKSGKRKIRIVSAALFTLVIALVFGASYFIKTKQTDVTVRLPNRNQKMSTQRGESKYILLPDSTQVWLNAESSLQYPDHFDPAWREVTLSGEAYFDVKHAAERPFIIHTGDINTTVLGTAFNINAYAGRSSITVSVKRGKVKVSRGDQVLALLVKNQELKVNPLVTNTPQKVVATHFVAAWQLGTVVYDDETLGDIIADLQRIYNVNIQFTEKKMSALRVTTRFRRELGVGRALEILCRLTDTHVTEKKGIYFIQ